MFFPSFIYELLLAPRDKDSFFNVFILLQPATK